jgi:hypothetical protein
VIQQTINLQIDSSEETIYLGPVAAYRPSSTDTSDACARYS